MIILYISRSDYAMKKLKFRYVFICVLFTLSTIPILFFVFHINGSQILRETVTIIEAVEHAIDLKALTATDAENTDTISNFKKDAIIGIAKDTDPKNLAVFAYSFRSVNSNAEIYLFINEPISKQAKTIADDNQIILIPIETYSQTLKIDIAQNFHPSTTRWPLMLAFLKQSKNRFQRLLFLDIRDSYFQKDPFLLLPNEAASRFFYAFTGVESITIKECGWNSGWVKDCFNQDIIQQIGSRNIICSGVSLADNLSAIDYLEKMTSIIMKSPLPKQAGGQSYKSQNNQLQDVNINVFYKLLEISKFPQCERNGVDQGVHNVLVHSNVIPNLKIFKQSDGFVSNMQSKAYRIDENTHQIFAINSKRINSNEHQDLLFSIVHQYDRLPSLQSFLFRKVRPLLSID